MSTLQERYHGSGASRRWLRRHPFACGVVWLAVGALLLQILCLAALRVLDQLFPLPALDSYPVSTQLLDRDDRLLRAYTTDQGDWRLPVKLEQVDKAFVEMLIAYEDRRFHSHAGVDGLALLRALGQWAGNGRIVSGASTLTMQLARLHTNPAGSALTRKAWQLLRAWQIERTCDKRRILEHYLTLAPYGGNLQGVRAASLAWFGKEPSKLSLQQSALLVALPQASESRRPDRHPQAALQARNRVLRRLGHSGAIEAIEIERAAAQPLGARRHPMPAFAPHLADRVRAENPQQDIHRLTIDRRVQSAIQSLTRRSAARLPAGSSIAIVLADATTGEMLAQSGSADYFNPDRAGWIDMSVVPRSPGSALKPLIYALAFDEGLITADTLMQDQPTSFNGYRPVNFDRRYQGELSVREALQQSLNVPATQLLEHVGPEKLVQRLHRAGLSPKLPGIDPAGLAVGLGGIGLSLRDLVQLQGLYVNHGRVLPLHHLRPTGAMPKPSASGKRQHTTIVSDTAAWQVSDILAGMPRPSHALPRPLAYKTGTSYGHRDAWAIGHDGRYVVGVWVGRADNGSVPGINGAGTAAPILFQAMRVSGLPVTPLPTRPTHLIPTPADELPAGLARFTSAQRRLVPLPGQQNPLRIVYPPADAQVELHDPNTSTPFPLTVKLHGGQSPFRWVVNGTPLAHASRTRTLLWDPDSPGESRLSVVDADGQSASVSVQLVW